MNRFNGRGVRVRHSKSQENRRHGLGIMETSLIRPPVFTKIPLVLSFNNSLWGIYYIPNTILGTGDTAVNKIDNVSALMELAF